MYVGLLGITRYSPCMLLLGGAALMRYVVDTSYLHFFYEVIVHEAVTAIYWFICTLCILLVCAYLPTVIRITRYGSTLYIGIA